MNETLRLTRRVALCGAAARRPAAESPVDNAGHVRLDDARILIQSIDWLAPVADDPIAFGAIAAASALSSIYARGGQPLAAVSLATTRGEEPLDDIITAVARGGETKLQEAGCPCVGTHVAEAAELRFGYAVSGVVESERVMSPASARPGDVLILTKPVGTGIIATAAQAGLAPADTVASAIRSMSTLDRIPARNARRFGARAGVSVGGLGVAGHALQIAQESGVTLALCPSTFLPLPGVSDLLPSVQSGGLDTNRRRFGPAAASSAPLERVAEALLYDPQTSGGLLLVLPAENEEAFLADHPLARAIGYVEERSGQPLRLVE